LNIACLLECFAVLAVILSVRTRGCKHRAPHVRNVKVTCVQPAAHLCAAANPADASRILARKTRRALLQAMASAGI
jgi:hypothetical protein